MGIFRLAIATLLLLSISPVWSNDIDSSDASTKGLAIAKEQVKRDSGWVDSTAELIMTLKNRNGDESTRNISVKVMEGASDGDKSLLVFNTPLNVKGTSFLTYSHINSPDDQWIFLPALKRVKRISSRNKTGPFMGSEFSYEDLTAFEHEKYTYLYLRDETLNEKPCYVIEQYPVDKYSGYTKRIVWIDQAEFRPYRIEFYDRKNSLLKTLDVSGYEKYIDEFWRPTRSTMSNHQTGKSTELSWRDYAFKVGLDSNDFKKNSLKRQR